MEGLHGVYRPHGDTLRHVGGNWRVVEDAANTAGDKPVDDVLRHIAWRRQDGDIDALAADVALHLACRANRHCINVATDDARVCVKRRAHVKTLRRQAGIGDDGAPETTNAHEHNRP